jgi:RNA polymerase sigma factor (sigma-70 family)
MDHPLEHELTRHAAALRSMAHALVHPGDVDDLVQDVALQVLRKPPARPGRLGGLLMTILRQLASKRRRGEARRRQREQQAAKSEATASAEQALEQNEMVERLLRELLALPQPYREVLLQRFFEDRWPAQIAASTGVPVETVKTRIKRGLSLLRERLAAEDDDKGEWRALLSGAFGLSKTAVVAAGVVAMGTGVKLAIGSVAAAAVAVVGWWAWQPGAPVSPTTQVARQDASAPAVATLGTKATPIETSAPDRRELAPPPPITTALATIRGRCIDEAGQPAAGIAAKLTGTPRKDRSTTFQGSIDWREPPEQVSGADGTINFSFVPPPPFCFELSVGGKDRSGGYGRWPEITPGQTIDLGDIPVIRCTLEVQIHVRDTAGLPVANTDCSFQWQPGKDLHSPLEIGLGGGDRTDATGNRRWTRMLVGSYRFQVHGREIQQGAEFTLTAAQPVMHHEVVVAPITDADAIRGIVVDDGGTPLSRVRVSGAAGAQRQHVEATTAKDGTFQLQRKSTMDRGPVQLWVNERGYESLFLDELFAWGRTDLRLVVRRGASLEVLAVDAAGAPVEDYRIWVVPRQGAFRSHYGRDNDVRAQGNHPRGLTTVKGLQRGPWFVIVAPADERFAISRPQPVDVGDQPARAVVRLRVAPHRLVRVVRGDGSRVAGSLVRVVDAVGTAPCVPGNARAMADWASCTSNGAGQLDPSVPILLQEITTDERGEATLRGVDDQPVTVSVMGSTHCPVQLDGVRLGERELLVITVSSGARLTGSTQPEVVRALRELSGLPPAGAVNEFQRRTMPLLSLQRGDANNPETFPEPGRLVVFDADGGFAFERVPPGRWSLVLHTWPSVQEHAETIASVELRDGEATTLQLELGALMPAELIGRVFWNDQPLDTSKSSAEKPQLHLRTTDLGGKPYEYWSLLQTDADGRFTWRGRAGTLTLDKSMILTAEESIVMSAGGKVTRDFHGSSGTLRIHLVDDAGQPMAQLSVALLDPAGQSCPTLPPTGADGTCHREIATGTYRVETRPKRLLDQQAAAEYLRTHPPTTDDAFAGARIHLGEVTVTAGRTTEATLRLPAEWSR